MKTNKWSEAKQVAEGQMQTNEWMEGREAINERSPGSEEGVGDPEEGAIHAMMLPRRWSE